MLVNKSYNFNIQGLVALVEKKPQVSPHFLHHVEFGHGWLHLSNHL